MIMQDDHPLERLRSRLSAPEDGYLDPTLYARLSVVEYEGLLHVDFFGTPFDEPYADLCLILRRPDVAESVASIVLRCPDEGANGTCNWDLTDLVESDAAYTALRLLSVRQNAPGDHNRMIVAVDYDEAGILGRFMQKAPILDALITPSAPDASFFSLSDHPLRYLNVDAGYATQDFIGNLANSRSFPWLQGLEFGEYNETDSETFPKRCTAFSDYRRLFLSQAFATVRSFTWRNPTCSPGEIADLRALRPPRDLQLKIVRYTTDYIRE